MRIFLYEFVTDGHWSATDGSPPPGSLAQEGRAMRNALAADLARIGSIEVLTLGDRHPGSLASEYEAFQRAARQADAAIVIAPEFDDILATRHRWAAEAGARVLGSPLPIIELTTDKHRTAEQLASRGLCVPDGRLLAAGQPLPRDFAYPAVLKPVDGAGSLGIRWIAGPDDLAVLPPHRLGWRLERFCPGMAASIALLCGPREVVGLPACLQLLEPVSLGCRAHCHTNPTPPACGEYPRGILGPFPSLARRVSLASRHTTVMKCASAGETSPFAYCGGLLPLPERLDRRARRLGEAAVAALGGGMSQGPLGWLGIDLILGEDPAGADDVVIEANARLTTSYLGLRRLARENLAAALLAVALGEPARLSFRSEPLQFAPDGCVTELFSGVH